MNEADIKKSVNVDSSSINSKEFSGVRKLFYSRNKQTQDKSVKQEDIRVDPDFKPLFLYEIDEESDLFVSD